ncbi:DUF5134 domain-containing protein [Nocardia panacis]|uniref:DUF5134 domain-containing protein n=1 Tax=Nocardia panacis TaxID=2340916 RepID=UPI00131517C7|nr:DUF5134 domain-containing protein [Nocardia panacis]
MAEFVEHYGALRWTALLAFVAAGAMVGARLRPVRPVAVNSGSVLADSAVCRESDAAHLLMCLVMIVMLIFPRAHALGNVLTAMTVAYAGLLVARLAEWRGAARPGARHRALAIGYHVLAAAAMWYAMSGHSTGGPALVPTALLVALFVIDACVGLYSAVAARPLHWPHPVPGRWSLLSHIVMDLGTAYMLVAAIWR